MLDHICIYGIDSHFKLGLLLCPQTVDDKHMKIMYAAKCSFKADTIDIRLRLLYNDFIARTSFA